MNTRSALQALFRAEGLSEEFFAKLDDCWTTDRFRALPLLELSVWKLLSWIGLTYPEARILAVYRSA